MSASTAKRWAGAWCAAWRNGRRLNAQVVVTPDSERFTVYLYGVEESSIDVVFEIPPHEITTEAVR